MYNQSSIGIWLFIILASLSGCGDDLVAQSDLLSNQNILLRKYDSRSGMFFVVSNAHIEFEARKADQDSNVRRFNMMSVWRTSDPTRITNNDSLVWWNLRLAVDGSIISGNPVIDLVIEHQRDILWLVEGNSYYSGVSVITIDMGIPPPSIPTDTSLEEIDAEQRDYMFDNASVSRAPKNLLNDYYGTTSIYSELFGSDILIFIRHQGMQFPNESIDGHLVYNTQAKEWSKLISAD